MFSGRITNCFDSHVHWAATGQFSRRLELHNLKSSQDVLGLAAKPENFRGGWLLGFGWNQNNFPDKKFPTRQILDQKFGDRPVVFTRIDGHASWVNTAALKLAGLWRQNPVEPEGGKIFCDESGWPTGILIDLAMMLVEKILPEYSQSEMKADLLAAQTTFHRAGFTHIRDLTCDDLQWSVAVELDRTKELKMAVEQFFSADDPSDFDKRVGLALQARDENLNLLRPKGIKVYFDGALGSEGALISKPYLSGSGFGLKLLDENVLSEMIELCFQKNLEIAIHVIGDEAAHRVAILATDLLKKGIVGQLHLEHVELLRPETIQLLKNLKVVCHMQPSHWLSDKAWLIEKIGDLSQFAFRWRELEEAEIPFDFGSDSPIEPTSIEKTFLAIEDAAGLNKNSNNIIQIPAPKKNFLVLHSHSDSAWTPKTFSEFTRGQLQSVHFLGEKII